jgi:hypothetical protein
MQRNEMEGLTMTEPKRPRVIPATARITKSRKPTRRQRLAELRAAQAWLEADGSRSGDRLNTRQLTGPEIAARRDIIQQRLAAMDEARMSTAASTLKEGEGS